ncbi:MAG: AAA domain-containing protein [Candidatus Heimdallarchaeota archaeon]
MKNDGGPMQSFAEYLNNLFKFYLGIIKVYGPSIEPGTKFFGSNVQFIEEQNKLLFFRNNRTHYFSIQDDKLALEKEQEEEREQTSSRFIADIYFTGALNQTSSADQIKEMMSQKLNLYNSGAMRLFSTFRRILSLNAKQIQKRNEVSAWYEKIGSSKIRIDDFPEQETKQLAPLLAATIGNFWILIERVQNSEFRVRKHYDRIPTSGEIVVQAFDLNEFLIQRKYNNVKELLAYNPNPRSSMSKLAAILNQWTIDSSLADPLEISSEFPFNEQQRKLLLNFAIDPLILVKGVAGTGKTTVAAHGAIELAKSGKKVLIVAQPHRVVDNLLMTIIEEAPEVRDNVIRLASKYTHESVSIDSMQYHETQVHERIKADILHNLDAAMERETDPEIEAIQQELKELIWLQQPEVFAKLINLSQKIVFSTIGGLFSSYLKISPNMIYLDRFRDPVQEFDLVIFEDVSDLGFVDFLWGSQFGHRWILLSDDKQIRPIVESTSPFPGYRSRTLPTDADKVEIIQSLEDIEVQSLGRRRLLERGDKLLRISAAEILLETDFLPQLPYCIELNTVYRFSRQLGEVLERVFPDFEFEEGIQLLQDENQEKECAIFEKYNHPLVFIDGKAPGKDKQEREVESQGDKPSYDNEAEAEILLSELHDFLAYIKEKNCSLSIGLISPYKPQAKLLRRKLRDDQELYDLYWEKNWFIHLPSESTVTVDTTHKQKSRQYDICLVSFVRQDITGIVNNEFYLFTALTRAKFANILVFDISTYQRQRGNKSTKIAWKNLLGLEKE